MNPFYRAGVLSQPLSAEPAQWQLARISGRDGRIMWNIPLSDPSGQQDFGRADPQFRDVDGDGSLDVAMILANRPDSELVVVSLRDGRRLWSRPVEDASSIFATGGPQLAIVDLDGDRRPEVLVTERPPAGPGIAFEVKAFDGATGTPRWTWRPVQPHVSAPVPGWLVPAVRPGEGKESAFAAFGDSKGDTWIVTLDAEGRATNRRKTAAGLTANPRPVDLDGDGRDELLLAFDGQVRAWGRDLADLWSWPCRPGSSRRSCRQRRAGPPRSSFPRRSGSTARPVARDGRASLLGRLPGAVPRRSFSTPGAPNGRRCSSRPSPARRPAGQPFRPGHEARSHRRPAPGRRAAPAGKTRAGRDRSPGWRPSRGPSSPRLSSRCSDSRRSTSSRRSRSSGWACDAGPGRSAA